MLSLIELQNKKVEAKRKKYEKDEMDAYLELVFDNYKQLTEENAKLTEQLRNKERQMQAERDDFNTKIKTLSDGVQYYRSIETTLQKALILAEKTSKETKDAAILKAESIEKAAHLHADKIYSAHLHNYRKKLIHTPIFTHGAKRFYEKVRYFTVGISQQHCVICIRRHSAYTEQNQRLKASYILLRLPYLRHVIFALFVARRAAFSASSREIFSFAPHFFD